MPRLSRRMPNRRYGRKRRSSRKGSFQSRAGYSKGTSPSMAKPYTPGRVKYNGRRQLGVSSAMPGVFHTTHRYVTNMELEANTTSGFIGNEVYFRLNDLYEVQPSSSPGVHQPLGWNEMRNWYINSTVWKVDVQIRLIYSTVDNDSNSVVINTKTWSNNYTPTGLDLATASEQPNTIVLAPPSTGRQPQTFETSYYVADILGIPRKTIFMDDRYSNLGNAKINDGFAAAMGVSVGNWNLDTTNNKVRVVTTLTYHTRWSKAANPGPS